MNDYKSGGMQRHLMAAGNPISKNQKSYQPQLEMQPIQMSYPQYNQYGDSSSFPIGRAGPNKERKSVVDSDDPEELGHQYD